jgi:hypothetical protein
MNVKNAFLNAELDETIFTVFPKDFDDGSGDIFATMQVTIWIKKSPRQWFKFLTRNLNPLDSNRHEQTKNPHLKKRLHAALVR